MRNINWIYKINPALLGGICGGFTGLVLYTLFKTIMG